jgi:archaellum component FlaC
MNENAANSPITSTTYFEGPAPRKNSPVKSIIIGILAAGLIGTWGYFLYAKNNSDKKIAEQQTSITKVTDEKGQLQVSFNATLARLDSVTSANNVLQGEKNTLQKDIDNKKSQIRKILNDKNATASQLDKAKTMIADLNDKITGLENQVAQLTTQNQQLTTDNSTLKQQKSGLEENLATTNSQKQDLEKTLDVASTFSASNIQITPVDERKNGKEKETTIAKKVKKLVVSFDVENRIAKPGETDMYLVVTTPDGKVITETGNTLSTRSDGDKPFTTKLSVNYDQQGAKKNVQFPIRQDDFMTGDYKIEIYQNGFKIGESTRSLRKGRLIKKLPETVMLTWRFFYLKG